MAGERVTARKRKAGGKVVIKKRMKKFARHQSDQFMRVPVRQPPASFPWQRGAAGGLKRKPRRAEGAGAGAGRGGGGVMASAGSGGDAVAPPAAMRRRRAASLMRGRCVVRRRAGGGRRVWNRACG